MPLINVEGLTKEFKRPKRKEGLRGALQGMFKREYETKTAIDNITFKIEKGEIVGYLGPNGAGKSTTVKTLSGILVPTSGRVDVGGLVPYENRVGNAKRIGVVFGQRTQLWWDIPVSESFNLMRYMYKIPEAVYRKNLKLFNEIMEIDEFMNVSVRMLSLGQRMRADLCVSLLHNPEILYLDEPTIGLDVVVKEKIREFIREINREHGTTVILTTHDMSDVEKLCRRVIVIDHGRIMYDDALSGLKDIYGEWEQLTAEIENPAEGMPAAAELHALGADEAVCDGAKIIVRYSKKRANSTVIIKWLMDRYTVKDFKVMETELEEVIRNMYGSIKAGAGKEESLKP